MSKFQGSIKKELEFAGVIKKIMSNFHESWFSALKILMSVTQFCPVSGREASFCMEFPQVK